MPGAQARLVARGELHVLPGQVVGLARLYDLAADPVEAHDLSAEHPEMTARLQARLRTWHAARAPEAPPQGPGQDGARVEAELRELGYAGD